MNFFTNLKTSKKLSLSFSLMGFFSFLLFLVLINITYFFIWYAEQKEMSFSEMNQSYANYIAQQNNPEEIQIFQNYLLTKDTLIIPDIGELICSPGVAKKIHGKPEEIQERFFYKDEATIYFIYSQYYEGIGEVKVFFDITQYLQGQIRIIQISFIFMVLMSFLFFFLGNILTKYLLQDLKSIASKVSSLSLSSSDTHIVCNLPKNDEISILVDALNTSYAALQKETLKLKQFQTDVSHEFKTPLMEMQSRLSVLQKKYEKGILTGKEQADFFEIARKSIRKMNTLIETLFFLSRCELANESCKQREDFSVEIFFQEKKEEILTRFPDIPLTVRYDVEENLVYHIGKENFSILLNNLIENAIKFSQMDLVIILTARKDFLSITDNGVGISESEREKIFEKFYRKDTHKPGFGVGLSIVKRIVDIYGWEIELTSELGKGTQFKFIF